MHAACTHGIVSHIETYIQNEPYATNKFDSNGPAGSAVCVFGMEEILAMYEKQYRYHDANQWKVSSSEKAIDVSHNMDH